MDLLSSIKDLVSNPGAYAEMLTDRLRNFNAGKKAVIRPDGAGMVPMTREERTAQFTQGALDNLGSGGLGALGVIKPRGGNWLSGQVEDALRGLRRYAEPSDIASVERNLANPEAAGVTVTPDLLEYWQNEHKTLKQHEAINQWIEGPLTKYIKRDMASPSDPIRALADQGILHVTPEQLPFQDRSVGVQRIRKEVGTPVEGIAQTPLGQSWENSADRFIAQAPADYYKYVPEKLQKDPWLANIPPETPIYDVMGSRGNELGFNHLIDELSNSLREGRLRPEQLQSGSLSVEGAVRHVAEINALRAKKAQEALAADMEGMPLHKEYPTEGMSWRQLKMPERKVPEGYQYDERTGNYVDLWDESVQPISGKSLDSENRAKLERWLTQEGDAMGHCVGGYCDDVVSGRSNIYSLRDAKGQPHVTIETAPPEANIHGGTDDAAYDAIWNQALAKFGPDAEGSSEFMKFVDNGLKDLHKDKPARIVQIKGKGNAAPNAKYLPFVQDFIRSGKWSDIQDAQNTGLTPEEINQLLGR